MSEQNAITATTQIDGQTMESLLLGGDLSALAPAQRTQYYLKVCESLGLNPLTKPFDYMRLNGKLTLYARKDAADQLRNKNNVSIGKPDIQFQDEWIIVTVSATDANGRTDSDVGVVNKKDMQGNFGNALMKAVTKAKRRVTLSICGLGMLDETEVQDIPGAQPGPAWVPPVVEAGEDKPLETEDEQPAIELIDPMSDWAVSFAAKAWNVSKSEAAKAISTKNLGKRYGKQEFVDWVSGAPQA